ncbi:MAG: tRNA (adenosine(37)-N6)-dimethylallyltransferase MiaA, partial [Syntrophaceae bacterium]|nr:tRNA (adenosine(37)-N6)-dimethylallyltransferase MiaA [Syntrophaceae bacterium]
MISPVTSPLIIVVGPTASGKTELVNSLAENLQGPIISADSMQVYRYMDIGTAKPSPEERKKYDYHLIDVVNPDEAFNGAMFLDQARVIIEKAPPKGPVYIVGGTGLYVRILLGGLINTPGPDEELRIRYKKLAAEHGKTYLHELLQKRDPKAAARLNQNDAVRIIRALEVLDMTGESITCRQDDHSFRSSWNYRCLKIGVSVAKAMLKQRIENRVDRMIEAGIMEETKWLLDQGYGPELKSMQSLGYRHMMQYLQGNWSLEEAIAVMKRET